MADPIKLMNDLSAALAGTAPLQIAKAPVREIVLHLHQRRLAENVPMKNSHHVLSREQLAQVLTKVAAVAQKAVLSVPTARTSDPYAAGKAVDIDVGLDSLLHNLCLFFKVEEPA